MKTKIMFIVLLLLGSMNLLYAQDRMPNQRKLMYNGVDSVLFNSVSPNFLNNNIFMVGYHWTNESSISRSILATQNNVYAQYMNYPNTTIPDTGLIQPNAYLMVEGVDANYKEGVFSHVLGDTGILNARYFSFKPNMKINPSDDQYDLLS